MIKGFGLAYLFSFISYLLCTMGVLGVSIARGVVDGSYFITFLLMYSLYGLPLVLVGSLIGEAVFNRISPDTKATKRALIFILTGFAYGAVVYMLLSSSGGNTDLDLLGTLFFGAIAAIGSLVFSIRRYKTRSL